MHHIYELFSIMWIRSLLNIRVGIISGDIASLETINEYASIPSREGLLTMLAGGMIQYVKDLSISLNLYAEQLEGKED